MSSDALAPYRRLTIKIGSALLVDGKTGKLRALRRERHQRILAHADLRGEVLDLIAGLAERLPEPDNATAARRARRAPCRRIQAPERGFTHIAQRHEVAANLVRVSH